MNENRNRRSAGDVAAWMLEEFNKSGELHQANAVEKIERLFGSDFLYENENGNTAIDKRVLAAFRKMTEGKAVWSRGGFFWRRREKDDIGRAADF